MSSKAVSLAVVVVLVVGAYMLGMKQGEKGDEVEAAADPSS